MKLKAVGMVGPIRIILSLLIGLIASLLLKDVLTPILLSGKGFEGRNFIIQLLLICLFTLIFAIFGYLLITLIQRIFPKQTFQIEQLFKDWNNQLASNTNKRIILVFGLLSVGFLSIYIINNVLSHIDTMKWEYVNPEVVPAMLPIGQDFRLGLYLPAENLVKSGFKSIGTDGTYPSIYPPLINVISLPYLLYDGQTAYLVHVGLILLANIASLLLASLIVKDLIKSQMESGNEYPALISIFLFFALAIYTFSSYPLAFSVERGNNDIFAIFFALLAIRVLLKKPEKIWLQVILLSLATHLKIYPAALFAILLFKHGKKIILPAIVINLVFLFALGPENAFSFIKMAVEYNSGGGVSQVWVGNHSAYSFARGIVGNSSSFLLYNAIFMLTPIVLWGAALLGIYKNKDVPEYAILFFMVTVPLMDLIPTISHDYKLVIFGPAALLFIGYILKQIIRKHDWQDIFQLACLVVILLFIGRPYDMSALSPYQIKEGASFLANNKYLWSLAFEVLVVFNIFRKNQTIENMELNSGETVSY